MRSTRTRCAHTLISLALLTLAGLSACASRPRAGQPAQSAAPRRPPIALQQASSYETLESPNPVRGEAADAQLAETLASVAQRAQLRTDGRLAELALGIAAGSDRAQEPPSYALIAYHAHRAGIVEPTPQVWLASGSSVSALLPALEQTVLDATRNSRLTHLGAGAVFVDPAEPEAGVVIAVALSTRALALRVPVPRSVPVGSVLTLEGELAAGHASPVLAVTSEDGSSRTPLGSGRSFSRAVQAQRAGELTLELLAQGPEGLTVVALMPVKVGAPVDGDAPAFSSLDAERDPDEVARKLLALIAGERAQRKLARLRTDPRLAKIALAHSQDMLEHDFVAHTSRRTGDASARVREAGLQAVLVMENIGRGYSASELHRGLMESPGHRANILHPDARELGIGVVVQREGDRNAFLVTELLTQLREEKR